MSGLLTTVLAFLLALGPLVVLFFLLPKGRACPQCGEETLLLRSPLLWPVHRLLSLRWCLRCGWDGLVRQQLWRRPLPTVEVVPTPRVRRGQSLVWRRQPEDSRE